jgi:ABC-2 type transport system ATP-binding protein
VSSVANGAPPVQLTDVHKHFGAVHALQDVTLDVRRGELFGIIGPDGAGKTTLFRILATLLTPDAGTAQVLGRDVGRDLWDIRHRLGYMPGRFSLYGDLTVMENLSFFASVFGTTVDAGRAAIAPIWSQLSKVTDRRASALSGGMKQKLALCCALVHTPELLLLDEPTTGVDAVSRREFWDLLDTLRQDGLTIVVATPYMDEAARCDRIALMQHGRCLAIDAPALVSARFPRPLFAVTGRPRDRLLAVLRAMPGVVSAYPFGETVHVSVVEPMHTDLATALTNAGIADVRVRAIQASIEDAFMELMAAPARAVAA